MPLLRTALVCAGLWQAESFAPVRAAPKPLSVPAALPDSTTLVVGASVVGLLGVIVGAPYLAYQRLSNLEGADYKETIFTDALPPSSTVRVAAEEEDVSMVPEAVAAEYAQWIRDGRPALRNEQGDLYAPGEAPRPAPPAPKKGGFKLPFM